MRELNVADLPPAKESARTKTVVSFIADKLTHYRNLLKGKVR